MEPRIVFVEIAVICVLSFSITLATSYKLKEDHLPREYSSERVLKLHVARSGQFLKENLFSFYHLGKRDTFDPHQQRKCVSPPVYTIPPPPTFPVPPPLNIQDSISFEEFLSALVTQSYGEWGDGGITVTASFPAVAPAAFTWLLIHPSSQDTIYTRGRFSFASSRVTTMLTLDSSEVYFLDLALYITLPQGAVYLSLDKGALRTPGEMTMRPMGKMIESPDEIRVAENGTASFVVSSSLPRSTNDLGLDVFYTFLDTSLPSPKLGAEILYSTLDQSVNAGTFEDISVDVGENAQRFGGTVSVSAFFSSVDLGVNNSHVKHLTVDKTLQVIPFGRTTAGPDGVAFLSHTKVIKTQYLPACIKHESIYCSAVGNEIRILKDGHPLHTYEFGRPGVFKEVFYPLDGKSPFNAKGVYTCEASGGNRTITRLIVAM